MQTQVSSQCMVVDVRKRFQTRARALRRKALRFAASLALALALAALSFSFSDIGLRLPAVFLGTGLPFIRMVVVRTVDFVIY